jgi:hypothetical protein
VKRSSSSEALIATISVVAIVFGVWAVGRAIADDSPTSARSAQVAANSSGAASAAGASSAASASAGHDHSAPAVDDRGFSQLENGHQHATQFEEPMDEATRAQLAHQLEVTRQVALQYPTVADAVAAGYHRVGPFIPGLGAHYMNAALITKTLNPDGVVDESDLHLPIMLIYDGLKPQSHVAGLMYYSMSKQEPQGFAGPNDLWHYHTNLCLVYGKAGIDLPYGADQDVSQQQCDSVHGQLLKQSNWMVHVWTVPGYESSVGTFSHTSPALPCPDGTFYSVPLASDIGTRASLCRDAGT